MVKGWADARARVHDLYITQRRPLHEVVRLMRANHGFDASPRAYKTKFKEWGYEKNRAGVQRRSRSDIETDHSEVNATSLYDISSGISTTSHEPNAATNTLPSLNLFDPISPWAFPASPSYQPNARSSQGNLNSAAMELPNFHPPFNGQALGSRRPSEDINSQDYNGLTRLHHSVIKGSMQEIEDLLYSGARIDIQDSNGDQPLHYAVSRAMERIIHLLLKRGADVNSKGRGGMTPLHLSLKLPRVLKALLKAGPVVSAQNESGDTALHLALSSPQAEAPPKGSSVEKLIFSGADVNVSNNLGVTPFHMILGNSWLEGAYSAEYVVMFLEHGALISTKAADGRLPFEIFLNNCNSKWMNYQSSYSRGEKRDRMRNLDFKMFIAKGADPNTRLASGESLFNDALKRCIMSVGHDRELGQILLDSADINSPGLDGNCPLHCLLQRERIGLQNGCIEDLLRLGANPNQTNDAGESPLLVLSKAFPSCNRYFAEFYTKITSSLLQSNADPMQRDLEGELPIYFVARNDTASDAQREIFNLLLEESQPDARPLPRSYIYRDEAWWECYYSLYQAISWSTPAVLVDTLFLLPTDVSKLICTTALDLLAKKFLMLTKTNLTSLKETQGLQSSDVRSLCNEFVAILRDCKALDINVDQSWYHFLLEFI